MLNVFISGYYCNSYLDVRIIDPELQSLKVASVYRLNRFLIQLYCYNVAFRYIYTHIRLYELFIILNIFESFSYCYDNALPLSWNLL